MRRLVTAAAFVAVALPAGAVAATTPDTTPPATEPTEELAGTAPADSSAGTAPSDTLAPAGTPQQGMPVSVYDDDGNVVASITTLGVEPGWTDYGDDDAPDEGREYVRVTVSVTNETSGDDTFSVSVDQFVLQDSFGSLSTAENIRTAAQAEADEDPIGDAELAGGESVELALTFQIDADADPDSVFYRPDDETLVDVAEIM